ncbi:SAV_6107 family HEPN domain-containing protein [Corynebacterium sp. TA-R-1]|uniref:SAV_6107 family HEPN domain-containing protein n=1 Tax=Corynebacterium stercoris TaxID=2943490 RepID=A0ABT1FY82_9CORY|nr:SAV_6107 family HEPN domain-containing protein [Corynebacterium stercoris]MCP1386727.1 SAV_6107 family HEPN domain-containing protein [Corynebacterium stercoris]
MNSIISATTNSTYGTAARPSRRDVFLASAEDLLAAARADLLAGQLDLAMENAYRAALRVAGAVNAGSPVIRKRKRLPTSAWDKLALTGDDGKEWANRFRRYSRERGRVASGIQRQPDGETVRRLLADAEAFYLSAVPGQSPAAA